MNGVPCGSSALGADPWARTSTPEFALMTFRTFPPYPSPEACPPLYQRGGAR